MRVEVGLGGGTAEAVRTAKLVDGARAFEGMMLEQMLKPLAFGGAPGAEEEGAGSETTRGLGTEALAKAVASGGGFGMARQIVRQVTEEDRMRGAGKV